MWEPRRLTNLWAFTAFYRDSFTFLPLLSTYMEVPVMVKEGEKCKAMELE
jgi:hypothetical protein